MRPEVVAYRLELLHEGGTRRLVESIHAQRRRLMADGMSEPEAREWVAALGFKVGLEPFEAPKKKRAKKKAAKKRARVSKRRVVSRGKPAVDESAGGGYAESSASVGQKGKKKRGKRPRARGVREPVPGAGPGGNAPGGVSG